MAQKIRVLSGEAGLEPLQPDLPPLCSSITAILTNSGHLESSPVSSSLVLGCAELLYSAQRDPRVLSHGGSAEAGAGPGHRALAAGESLLRLCENKDYWQEHGLALREPCPTLPEPPVLAFSC